MSEEMEVVCLLCLSDDKLPAETFWAICQVTNRSQRRFEPFVRWQIVPRDVLSHLSDDKSFPEPFWAICQMTNCPQRRFEPFVRWQIVPRDVLSHLSDDKSFPETFWDERSLRFKKNDDLRVSPFWSFAWKGIFMDCHADARNDGWSPLWLLLVPSLNFTNSLNPPDSPLLEEWNRRGFSSVA